MYTLRISGSNDFISSIDKDDATCVPQGSCEVVSGWSHPKRLKFWSLSKVNAARETVLEIEGYHTTIEEEN